MDEVTLSSITLIELGLATQAQPTEALPSRDHIKANLPAIPETVPGANRMLADLIDLAALEDPNHDREKARDVKRGQLVRNPDGRVHYAAIEFEPEIQANGDVHAVAHYSFVPEKVVLDAGTEKERVEYAVGIKSRKVIPFYYAGPEFLKPTTNGGYISGGTFQCIVFESDSKAKNAPLRALLLGMANPKTIRTWNEIAERRNALAAFRDDPWPIITVIEHELRRPGVRRIRFIPRFDLHKDLQSGCSKRQLLGCHFGQKVYLAAKATVPECDVQDGVKGFFEKHLFRVKRLKKNSIEVVWLGKASEVQIEDRIAVDEVNNEMNPFVVLNTTPTAVDWKTVDQSTRKWLNRTYNEKNPLYLAGLELGLVKETDDNVLKRAHLEQLWQEAVRLIRMEMLHAAEMGRKQLTIAPNKPSLEEILGSETEIETVLLYLNEPEDAAAIWISRVLDRPFDPKSPYLMHLRTWLINTYPNPGRTIAPPIPDIDVSRVSIQVPVLTPLPQNLSVPPPPTHRREVSHPAFQVNPAIQQESAPHTAEDIVVLDDNDLEECIEDEHTTVDFERQEELSFANEENPDEAPPRKFFAKAGSILHTGSLKDGYTTK